MFPEHAHAEILDVLLDIRQADKNAFYDFIIIQEPLRSNLSLYNYLVTTA
jgi:hypothetical protein